MQTIEKHIRDNLEEFLDFCDDGSGISFHEARMLFFKVLVKRGLMEDNQWSFFKQLLTKVLTDAN